MRLMQASPFRRRLEAEFRARRAKNPRYSLRAFAAFLGTDHSSLSQILRSLRRIPARQIRSWGKKLAMLREETAAYIAAEYVPDGPASRRQDQLRHWTAEAMAIVTGDLHRQMLCLTRTRGFRPDCRWIARHTGADVDQVNVALSRLLRLRLLEITSMGAWKELTGLKDLNRESFLSLALTRVREKAAEDGIEFHKQATTKNPGRRTQLGESTASKGS
jgi:hypothetical protein